MQKSKSNRRWPAWLVLAGMLGGAFPLFAGGIITGVISSLSYFAPGSEQYLYYAPSDASRSQVKVSAVARFSASASVIAAQYRYVGRLLDSTGNLVSLRNPDGSATLAITFPQFSVTLGAGTGWSRSDTLSLSVADGVRLDRYSPYRVELTLQYQSAGGWVNEGSSQATSNRRFYHFINQTSGDAAYNVISEVLSVNWKKTSAIDSATDDAHWLEAEVAFRLHRYDNFGVASGSPAPVDTIPVRFVVTVKTGHGANVPEVVQSDTTSLSAASFVDGAVRTPWVSSVQVLRLKFHPSAQLPSGTEPDFQAAISIQHVEIHSTGSDVYAAGNTGQSEIATVLQFTGQLLWGGFTTSLSAFSNDPTIGLIRRGTDVSVALQNPVVGVPGIGGVVADEMLQVSLDDSGTARVLSGHASAILADADHNLHGIHYRFAGPIGLSASGVSADLALQLPPGMGVGKPGFALQSRLTGHVTALDASLQPVGTNVFALDADERVVLDTRPLYFGAPTIRWDTFAGELRFDPSGLDYVRREAFEALAAATDLPAEQTSKPSNERYYQFITGVAGTFTVRVTPEGRTGLSARFALSGGQFACHFPLGVSTAWSSGQLFLQDDVPIGISSGLVPAGPLIVAYEQGCPDGGCAGQTAELACNVPQFLFTPDSGLVAEGNAAVSIGGQNQLRWGHNPGRDVMAHEVGPFQKAAFAMSGHVLLGGALAAERISDGAGVLLESGAKPDSSATPSGVRMIRPGTTDYGNGEGQYPGLNLTRAAETDPAAVYGIARLGDAVASANFALTDRVKYYARRAGVSGLHEAADGGFPDTALAIYQYPFEFKTFGLSFLDNQNVDSETRCEIKLPPPVDARFKFDRLTFTCVGAPDEALIAAGQNPIVFRYWLAPVEAQGATFAPQNATSSACDASQRRFLGLASVLHGQGVQDALAGTLYLSPQGDILTPADTERPENVSFYLGAGSYIALSGVDRITHGPGNFYRMALGKAYLNHPPPADRTSTGAGWLSLFGGLKLPFYGETPVHVVTLPAENLAGSYFINGGWTEGSVPASDPIGDPTQRGVPPEMTYASYRLNTDFAPAARGEFLDVVDLSFRLQWFPVLKEFSGVAPVEHSFFFILQSSRELHRLSATDIAIELGSSYEGLPRVHLTTDKLDLVSESDDISDLNFTRDLGKAVEAVAGDTGVELAPEVRNGFSAVRSLAGGNLEREFRALAKDLVVNSAPGLRDAMVGACPGGDCEPTLLATRLHTAFAGLHLDEHTLLLEDGSTATAVRSSLVSRLGLAADSLRSLWDPGTGIFKIDPVGRRLQLAAIIRAILSTIRSPLPDSVIPSLAPILAALTDAAIAAELGEDTKRQKDIMFQAAARMDELRARYASDSGDLYLELRALFADPAAVAELNALLADAEHDLLVQASQPHWVAENVTGVGDLFEQQLASNVGNRLTSSEFFSRLDRTLEYHLRSVEEEGLTAVDSTIAMLQRMINRVGRLALGAADHFLYNFALDSWDERLGFFNAEGYVFFRGDEVRRLRIAGNGGITLARGFDFSAGVQFEINALDSEGDPSCATASPSIASECLLGFSSEQGWTESHTSYRDSDGSVEPDPSDRRDPLTTPVADVETSRASESFELHLKATFDSTTSLNGFGGGFFWATSKPFQALQVLRVDGACMFGPTEQYLAGALSGKLGGGALGGLTRVQGGLFLGHTCSLEPLHFINTDFADVLADHHEFTGFFVYGEGWFPVISGSCLLNLSLGVGVGVFGDFTADHERVGGVLLGGVSGEVLCLLSGTGTLSLAGSVGAEGFVFEGAGHLKVRIGYCPFCVRFTKDLGITYKSAPDEWTLR